MNSGRQYNGSRGVVTIDPGGPAAAPLLILTIACVVALLYATGVIAFRMPQLPHVPVSGQTGTAIDDAVDGLGVPYASRLTDGTSASARTRLFDAPADRRAQIEALLEDDAYAPGDGEHDVSYAENKSLFAACAPGAGAAPAVACKGRSGYILHLALRGNASPQEQSVAIDRYGARWAAAFARYHPQNAHCALVILASDVTAEDESENDDEGNAILRSKCFALGAAP